MNVAFPKVWALSSLQSPPPPLGLPPGNPFYPMTSNITPEDTKLNHWFWCPFWALSNGLRASSQVFYQHIQAEHIISKASANLAHIRSLLMVSTSTLPSPLTPLQSFPKCLRQHYLFRGFCTQTLLSSCLIFCSRPLLWYHPIWLIIYMQWEQVSSHSGWLSLLQNLSWLPIGSIWVRTSQLCKQDPSSSNSLPSFICKYSSSEHFAIIEWNDSWFPKYTLSLTFWNSISWCKVFTKSLLPVSFTNHKTYLFDLQETNNLSPFFFWKLTTSNVFNNCSELFPPQYEEHFKMQDTLLKNEKYEKQILEKLEQSRPYFLIY